MLRGVRENTTPGESGLTLLLFYSSCLPMTMSSLLILQAGRGLPHGGMTRQARGAPSPMTSTPRLALSQQRSPLSRFFGDEPRFRLCSQVQNHDGSVICQARSGILQAYMKPAAQLHGGRFWWSREMFDSGGGRREARSSSSTWAARQGTDKYSTSPRLEPDGRGGTGGL